MTKRILSILAALVILCTTAVTMVHAENEPTGFIFPTLPENEDAEDLYADTFDTLESLPGARRYELTLKANDCTYTLKSTGFSNISASEGDTGWVTSGTYYGNGSTKRSTPTEGTTFGLTGRVYTFENADADIHRVLIALPEAPVEGKSYTITGAHADTGVGLQINDLICCGCVKQTETRTRTTTERKYNSWSMSSYTVTLTQCREITNCFHYGYALTGSDDYFTVTVTKVTSGYIILAIEGCLNNGLNMISGEFCCQI